MLFTPYNSKIPLHVAFKLALILAFLLIFLANYTLAANQAEPSTNKYQLEASVLKISEPSYALIASKVPSGTPIAAPTTAADKTALEASQNPASDNSIKKDISKDINKNIILLKFSAPKGFYIYGHKKQEQGKVTRIGISELAQGAAEVFYPVGENKADLLNPGKRATIYDSVSYFIIALPNELNLKDNKQTLSISFSALLCSALNCTPINEKLSINTSDFDALAPMSPDIFLTRYPFVEALEQGSLAKPKASTDTTLSISPNLSPQNTLDKPVETLKPESPNLSPVYFNQGLEVNSFGKALLLGLLAGFILNFMPCVLPVLSLKLSGLLYYSTHASPEARIKSFREHCIFFGVGILTWFFALALILLYSGFVWGQFFQSPLIVMILASIILALSLSLFGVFNLPLIDLKVSSQNPRLQAFFTGVFATVLATPCSGPLLGGVLGWALQESPSTMLVVLGSVGLGMSSIYFMVAAFPNLIKFLPKPGDWMLKISSLVGFVLLGTAIWLLGSIPAAKMQESLILLLVLAFICWLWGIFIVPNASRLSRALISSLLLVAVLFSFWFWAQEKAAEQGWNTFEQSSFASKLGQENMMLTFTANWCPNCKALERVVLTPEKLAQIKSKYPDIHFIKVDLTAANPDGEALLKQLGSSSIPLLAIFKKGELAATPLVIRDIFSEANLDDALKQQLVSQ